MELFWNRGPLFVRELIGLLPDPKPHFNTVSTFVRILEQKGYVEHEKIGNSFRYAPAVTKEQYVGIAVADTVGQYFGGSAKELIMYLLRHEQLSDDDVWDIMDELRQSRKSR